MAERKFMTAPIATDKMPPAVPYIIGNEMAERFSFYGFAAILTIFLHQYIGMSESAAKAEYHNFKSLAYAFPLLGSLIADVFWGKYKTILYLSLVYCVGHGVLAVQETHWGVNVGLFLIALGAGGIKPCVSSNVGDQFGSQNAHLIPKVYSWFYFSINFGSFFSTLLTPKLLSGFQLGSFKFEGSSAWAFGVPGILMGIATFVFWLGRHKYVHIPPGGKGVVREALSGEGLKALSRLAILFVFVAMFWALYDQMSSAWVLQAMDMDRVLWGDFEVDAAQTHVMNPVLILLFIPLFTYVLYPAISLVFPLTPLRKIGIGMLLCAASFVVIARIEDWIALADAGQGPRPWVMWQVPAYMLMTAAEAMISITCLEFSYTQAPRRTKSMVMSVYLLSVALGNQFTALVNTIFGDDLTGSNYYWAFITMMLITFVIYVPYSLTYRGKTYIQEETPNPMETPDSA
jgi:POT family proton-dependent oligopeptide transporter